MRKETSYIFIAPELVKETKGRLTNFLVEWLPATCAPTSRLYYGPVNFDTYIARDIYSLLSTEMTVYHFFLLSWLKIWHLHCLQILILNKVSNYAYHASSLYNTLIIIWLKLFIHICNIYLSHSFKRVQSRLKNNDILYGRFLLNTYIELIMHWYLNLIWLAW